MFGQLPVCPSLGMWSDRCYTGSAPIVHLMPQLLWECGTDGGYEALTHSKLPPTLARCIHASEWFSFLPCLFARGRSNRSRCTAISKDGLPTRRALPTGWRFGVRGSMYPEALFQSSLMWLKWTWLTEVRHKTAEESAKSFRMSSSNR